jgi:glyoxylase-like metal-dependent hydrolase (beta-lactamase superfamily II)
MTNATATGVELEVIVTGEIPTPHGYVFRADGNIVSRLRAGLAPGGERVNSPCLAYVVRHPTAGLILIDTGLHPDARTDLRKDFGVAMSLLFRGLRPADQPFDQQLGALGIQPETVQTVVMTHLHVDHTSGMRLLPNATFTCSRVEWATARRPFAAAKGFVGGHLPPEERMQLLDFAADGEPYGPFASTIDLLGDGSVRLLYTPGHTPGHLSVLLRLTDGGRVLAVGDAAYTLRNIRELTLPMITADDEASRRSLEELKAFSESDPAAILIPSHDPDAWKALRGAAVASEQA